MAAIASTSSLWTAGCSQSTVKGSVVTLREGGLSCMTAARLQRRPFSGSPVAHAKPRRQRMANDDFALDKMGKFNFDDIPTLGHEGLHRQRELLHYARLVEWELPKLQALRTTYQPPAKEAILRLRSIHYQGEAHPATRKAVLTVNVSDLFRSGKLTSEAARRKFLLLAGTHWNPLEDRDGSDDRSKGSSRFTLDGKQSEIEAVALGTGVGSIKISCERFPNERMNVKWCSDAVDKMLQEANENAEDMKDVPLDLRHVKAQDARRKSFARHNGPSKQDFPKQWLPKSSS